MKQLTILVGIVCLFLGAAFSFPTSPAASSAPQPVAVAPVSDCACRGTCQCEAMRLQIAALEARLRECQAKADHIPDVSKKVAPAKVQAAACVGNKCAVQASGRSGWYLGKNFRGRR